MTTCGCFATGTYSAEGGRPGGGRPGGGRPGENASTEMQVLHSFQME